MPWLVSSPLSPTVTDELEEVLELKLLLLDVVTLELFDVAVLELRGLGD